MVDEKTELPVAEEPTPTAEAEPNENIDELMGVLKKFDISEPDKLAGRIEAGSEVGRMAQLLGDQRNLTAQKDVELATKETEIAKLMAQTEGQGYEYQEKPIDLASEVRKGVRQELQEQQNVMRKAQEASLAQYSRITGHPQYEHVKDVWEQRKTDPVYISKVQNGMVNPETDFYNDLLNYHSKVHQEAYKTIEKLTGGGPTPVPHVESGGTQSPGNIVSTDDAGVMPEVVKRKMELQAKVDKGYLPTEEELIDMVDSIAFAPVVPG